MTPILAAFRDPRQTDGHARVRPPFAAAPAEQPPHPCCPTPAVADRVRRCRSPPARPPRLLASPPQATSAGRWPRLLAVGHLCWPLATSARRRPPRLPAVSRRVCRQPHVVTRVRPPPAQLAPVAELRPHRDTAHPPEAPRTPSVGCQVVRWGARWTVARRQPARTSRRERPPHVAARGTAHPVAAPRTPSPHRAPCRRTAHPVAALRTPSRHRAPLRRTAHPIAAPRTPSVGCEVVRWGARWTVARRQPARTSRRERPPHVAARGTAHPFAAPRTPSPVDRGEASACADQPSGASAARRRTRHRAPRRRTAHPVAAPRTPSPHRAPRRRTAHPIGGVRSRAVGCAVDRGEASACADQPSGASAARRRTRHRAPCRRTAHRRRTAPRRRTAHPVAAPRTPSPHRAPRRRTAHPVAAPRTPSPHRAPPHRSTAHPIGGVRSRAVGCAVDRGEASARADQAPGALDVRRRGQVGQQAPWRSAGRAASRWPTRRWSADPGSP